MSPPAQNSILLPLLSRGKRAHLKKQGNAMNQKMQPKNRPEWVMPACLATCTIVLFTLIFTAPGGNDSFSSDDSSLFIVSPSSTIPLQEKPVPSSVPDVSLSSPPHLGADLPVERISQLPELINGCEATSLAIVLRYWGYHVSKETIAYGYLPSAPLFWDNGQRHGPNPEEAYAGNPATTSGFYCYENPVAEAANMYLQEHGDNGLRALARRDVTEDELLTFLDNGWPILVWKTIDNRAPYRSGNLSWIFTGTGEVYVPYMNLHVVVLRGYTDAEFLLSDPLGRESSIDRLLFLELFEQMGSRIVAITGKREGSVAPMPGKS